MCGEKITSEYLRTLPFDEFFALWNSLIGDVSDGIPTDKQRLYVLFVGEDIRRRQETFWPATS